MKIFDWIKERYTLDFFIHIFKEKEVPKHKFTFFYFFGGMALFFFIVQIISGIFLLLYYQGSADKAYESVKYIVTKVPYGWLVRSIHSWSANLMIFCIFIHMFSTYFLKAYRKPRELTWVTGFILLSLSLAFGFTGYLLPWNKLAFFATRFGTDMLNKIPIIGSWLSSVARGGEDVTGATLTRFFGVHVTVLPLIALGLLALHLFFIQVQGMSTPIGAKPKENIPFFPNFFLRDLFVWVLALSILAAVASLFPWELGEKADPFAPAPAGIKPEWYFLFMFQSLKLFPPHIIGIEGELLGIILFAIAGLLVLLVPFLDKKAQKDEVDKKFNIFGIISLLFIIIMTIYAWLD